MTLHKGHGLPHETDDVVRRVHARLGAIDGLPQGTILFGLDPAVLAHVGGVRPLVVVPLLESQAPIGRLGRALLGMADAVVPMHIGEALRLRPLLDVDCAVVLPERPARSPVAPPSPLDAVAALTALLDAAPLIAAAPQVAEPLRRYDPVSAIAEACVEALLACS